MRKRLTFLLTVMTPENETDSIHGQLKVISTGKTSNFTSLDELSHFINNELEDKLIQLQSEDGHFPEGENA